MLWARTKRMIVSLESHTEIDGEALTLLRQESTIQHRAIPMIHRIYRNGSLDETASCLLSTNKILNDEFPQIFVERGAMGKDQRQAWCFFVLFSLLDMIVMDRES